MDPIAVAHQFEVSVIESWDLFTDESGNYTFEGLPSGGYKLRFGDTSSRPRLYLSEWYDDQPDFSSADLVAVAEKEEVSLDVGLTLGATINGTVTDENTGTPFDGRLKELVDLNLTLYDSTASFMDIQIDESISPVDNVEHIYLQDLTAGTYTLEVSTADFARDYGLAWRINTAYEAYRFMRDKGFPFTYGPEDTSAFNQDLFHINRPIFP